MECTLHITYDGPDPTHCEVVAGMAARYIERGCGVEVLTVDLELPELVTTLHGPSPDDPDFPPYTH